MNDRPTLGAQVNTELARAFRQIVTAGWANKSDGNVEAPTGHFALVTIEPAELEELIEAVFDDSDHRYNSAPHCGKCGGPCRALSVTIYPGDFIVEEDSDGNTTLTEYLSTSSAQRAFTAAAREFAIWNATCPKCGNEGPHERLDGNWHKCACGGRWDPTEGVS